MNTRTDTFYRHLREWFTVFLPRQRAVSPHTITACRQTWNLLLGYVDDTRGIRLEKVTFAVLDRALIAGFLDHMSATRGWKASTYNQRLACIRSFFHYAATAEPTLAMHLADITGVPQKKSPNNPPVCHLTTSAITALLAAPDPATRTGLRDQFFMVLMYDLAARDAEMLALTVGDHARQWRMPGTPALPDTQIHVPVFAGSQPWGEVEFRFAPLYAPGLLGIDQVLINGARILNGF